jgi:hypothetical protein
MSMDGAQRRPLVSVVIPSFNHRRFVARALDSVLAQTCSDFEIVIVDDGSTDGSPELLAQRCAGDARMRLSVGENRGAHAALNLGIAQARGEFVAILNSDDAYEPERLERMLEQAHARAPRPFFGYSGVTVIDDADRPNTQNPAAANYATLLAKYRTAPALPFFWIGNLALSTSNFFFSRALFEQVGPFAALRYVHDWDWALRAQQHVEVVRLGAPLLRYRRHEANTIREHDPWRRTAENAYVFASALARQAEQGGFASEQLLQLFQRNQSFAPVPVLLLLGLGRSPAQLRAMLESGELVALLPRALGSSEQALALMQPLHRLREQLTRDPLSRAELWRTLRKRGARLRRELLGRLRAVAERRGG